MKQQINESKRLQQLAGMNEYKVNLGDNRPALGILFHPNEETEDVEDGFPPYLWDEGALLDLVEDMGYDVEEVEYDISDMIVDHPPETFVIWFRDRLNNPDLQITDLTVEMVKQELNDMLS